MIQYLRFILGDYTPVIITETGEALVNYEYIAAAVIYILILYWTFKFFFSLFK